MVAIEVKRAQGANPQHLRGLVGVQLGAGVHFADSTATPFAVVEPTARTKDAFGLVGG